MILETNFNETSFLKPAETLTNQTNLDIKNTICDKSSESGSRIKITKVNHNNEPQMIPDDKSIISEVKTPQITKTKLGPCKSKLKPKAEKRQYDSIGENEDSSDNLLPWEVKSTKKKKGNYKNI